MESSECIRDPLQGLGGDPPPPVPCASSCAVPEGAQVTQAEAEESAPRSDMTLAVEWLCHMLHCLPLQ